VEIVIRPILAELEYDTLNNLASDISREFENIKMTVATGNNSNLIRLKKDAAFQSSFDKDRNQWYSAKLLDWLFEKFRPNKDTKLLFILHVDAYSDGLNFVLGEAIEQAFTTYLKAKLTAIDNKIPLAPVDENKK
jgi:predicted Zn-dependent protease